MMLDLTREDIRILKLALTVYESEIRKQIAHLRMIGFLPDAETIKTMLKYSEHANTLANQL